MRLAFIFLGSSILQYASAHYVLAHFIVNETINPLFQYVRNVTPKYAGALSAAVSPHYDLASPNTRCGRDAMTSGNSSDIATVIAGSKIGFRLDFWDFGSIGVGVMFHNGPLLAYLSKSPDQTPQGLKSYKADGDWFKIHERGPDNDTHWFMPENWTTSGNKAPHFSEYNFTLPVTTPPGYYLLRAESIYPHPQFNKTQFYMNCAQIYVVGSEPYHNEPGPMVKFPRAYNDNDPGILIPSIMWDGDDYSLAGYKVPGPKVWTG